MQSLKKKKRGGTKKTRINLIKNSSHVHYNDELKHIVLDKKKIHCKLLSCVNMFYLQQNIQF